MTDHVEAATDEEVERIKEDARHTMSYGKPPSVLGQMIQARAESSLSLVARIRQQQARIEELERERDEARETIRRLNRRCQSYESGLAEKIERAQRSEGSFGRALANSAATMYRERVEKLEAALREIYNMNEPQWEIGSARHVARVALETKDEP